LKVLTFIKILDQTIIQNEFLDTPVEGNSNLQTGRAPVFHGSNR
jgi:hypothetical protein